MAKRPSETRNAGARGRAKVKRKNPGVKQTKATEQASSASKPEQSDIPAQPVINTSTGNAIPTKSVADKAPPQPASASASSPDKGAATESAPGVSTSATRPASAIETPAERKFEADTPDRSIAVAAANPVPNPGSARVQSAAAPARASKPPSAPAQPQAAPTQPQPVRDSEPAPLAQTAPIENEVVGAPPESEPVPVIEPVPCEEAVHYEESAPYIEQGPNLFIVHITPEMAPVAKVGGLADVVFGLSRELAIRGNHVEIILPKYDNLRYDHIFELHEVYQDLWVPWYAGAIHCTVYFGFVHDRKCFFIEPHSQDNFFNRGSIYGFNDDVLRYAFFSRAAMEFLFKAGKHPDIIHCHDWQTALAPVLLYEIYQHLGMTHPRVCLTIHNFKHQGVTGSEVLRASGLQQPERFFDYNRLRDNNNPQAINLLKGGIVYSNFVTTVSPRYAYETRDQGQGFGLEPTLHTHHMKFGGVVNGIDYDVWNPEVDHHIPVRYGIDSIDGKYDNKRALRHRLMLADNEKPLVAFIGRLDPQKGLELVRHAVFHALERGAQFVLLGSSPDQAINADFWGLKHMLNDSPDCHLEIGFDEDLAHLIYAGADMMLVPSQFEPCGLTQLISLRYGTVPVVRSVGGLADTVFDKDHSHRPLHERNGYTFEHYDQAGLESALGRAIDCYYHHPDHFRELMKNAMGSDYSWNNPGGDYLNIYDFIRHK